jgi:hypothetical protein
MVGRETISATVGVIALCLLPTAIYSVRLTRTVPTSFDVDLTVATTHSQKFAVLVDAGYEVQLQVDTPVPGDLGCFIARVFPDRCQDDRLDIVWRIFRDGEEMGNGRSRTEPAGTVGGSGAISRILGRVDLDAGTGYTVQVASRTDASALHRLRPRVRLEMLPGAADRYLAWAGAAATAGQGLLIVAAGGLWLVFLVRRSAA